MLLLSAKALPKIVFSVMTESCPRGTVCVPGPHPAWSILVLNIRIGLAWEDSGNEKRTCYYKL